MSIAAWNDRGRVYYTLTFLPEDRRPPPPPQNDVRGVEHDQDGLAEKIMTLKDAMFNAAEFPVYAVWKDASIAVANRLGWALVNHPGAVIHEGLSCRPMELMENVYTEDFGRRLTKEEHPIVKACRLQGNMMGEKVGLLTDTGRRLVYTVQGRAVFDKKGVFQVALLSLRDAEELKKRRDHEEIKSEQQFRNICDCMPQMVGAAPPTGKDAAVDGWQIWTTKADGEHDYFSQQWYEYTGATPEECVGSVRSSPHTFPRCGPYIEHRRFFLSRAGRTAFILYAHATILPCFLFFFLATLLRRTLTP